MECPVERFQQFVDVLVGALHRRQPAGVFAGQGLGAGAEERDEKIAADEHPQGRGASTDDLGQVSRRPWNGGEVAPPGFPSAGGKEIYPSEIELLSETGESRPVPLDEGDRKSTRLNSSHLGISYAVFCLKKKK